MRIKLGKIIVNMLCHNYCVGCFSAHFLRKTIRIFLVNFVIESPIYLTHMFQWKLSHSHIENHYHVPHVFKCHLRVYRTSDTSIPPYSYRWVHPIYTQGLFSSRLHGFQPIPGCWSPSDHIPVPRPPWPPWPPSRRPLPWPHQVRRTAKPTATFGGLLLGPAGGPTFIGGL